jgi:hypothetical protein
VNEIFVWSLSEINTSTIWATIYIYIYFYVYESNNDISKRWKDQTTRQSIYSGSATRTPSLPYSTPRVTYSRVFFTMSTSSLMAEKTLHTTTSSQLIHTFYTTSSQHVHTTTTSQLHTTPLLLLHTTTSSLLHNTTYISLLLFTTSTPRSI